MTIYRDTYGESLMVRIERLTRSANDKHERIDGTHRSDRQRSSPSCRFGALLSAEADFEFQLVALAEISTKREVDVVLLGVILARVSLTYRLLGRLSVPASMSLGRDVT